MRKVLFLLLITSWSSCQSSLNRNSRVKNEHTVTTASIPTPSIAVRQPPNESKTKESKSVPDSFKHIDFKNFSYGRYRFYGSARTMNLTLDGSEREYQSEVYDRGWFSIHDVYYADVTSDRKPEAIVVIWHVSCGAGSCDGGAALIYVYEADRNKLHQLWKYETGSRAYGCGLKSLTIDKGKVTMELFGRCVIEGKEYPGSGKFGVRDTTQMDFKFNGKRLVMTSRKFLSVPERDVKNYQAEIRIN